MRKLILCEGKTDAILLSYYMEKVCGWAHTKTPKELSIIADEIRGESAYWYKKDNDLLLICAVGGKDNFGLFFKNKIYATLTDSSSFSKISVVTDRDDRTEALIIRSLQAVFEPIITHIQQNIWMINEYNNSFGERTTIDFLLLVIPEDKEGALETLLLDAISENEYNLQIVNRCKEYINEIEPIASRYIGKKRLKLKATLGITWAIQYPKKIFTSIDQQIRSVKWEDSSILEECFRELVSI